MKRCNINNLLKLFTQQYVQCVKQLTIFKHTEVATFDFKNCNMVHCGTARLIKCSPFLINNTVSIDQYMKIGV